MRLIKTLFLILILSTAIIACGTQVLLYGYVHEYNSNTVLPQAVITAQHSDGIVFRTRANQFGLYQLIVPNCGLYIITAKAKAHTFASLVLPVPVPDTGDSVFIEFTGYPVSEPVWW